jgi:hypothetical protein
VGSSAQKSFVSIRWWSLATLSSGQLLRNILFEMASECDVVEPQWCEPEHLLASIYSFSHQPCSRLQSQPDIDMLCSVLSRFTAGLVNSS